MTRREILGAAFAIRLPRKIRAGIIGLDGHVSEITAPLPDLPDVELVSYASAQPVKNGPLAKAKHYSSHLDMLDHEKLDVVGVTTDDGARAAAILDCVNRKINVVAEKPLGRTRAEYDSVKKAVLASKIHLGMMLPLRFAPHFLALRQIVQSGEIGEVAQIQGQKSYKAGASSGWKNHQESYSGTIPWVGIHMLDLMLYTSGRSFTECASFQSRVGWPEIGVRENTAAVLFRMDNGGAATLTMDYLRPDAAESHDDDRLRLAGTKGVAEYQRSTGVTVITGSSKIRQVPLPPAGSLFKDYLDAAYNGKPTILPLAEIWRANEIAFTARDAANTGRVVPLG